MPSWGSLMLHLLMTLSSEAFAMRSSSALTTVTSFQEREESDSLYEFVLSSQSTQLRRKCTKAYFDWSKKCQKSLFFAYLYLYMSIHNRLCFKGMMTICSQQAFIKPIIHWT